MQRLLQVDVTVLTFVLGSLIPLLTAVVTKVRASSSVKALVNLSLSVAAGVAAWLIQHDGRTTVGGLATAAITTYLASGVSYQNLWKPLGAAPAVAVATSQVGIGPAATTED